MNVEPTDAQPAVGGEWLQARIIDARGGEPARLVVTGELDRCSAQELRHAVAEILCGMAPATLQIDASGIGFLDSSGIHCLLICRADAHAAGTRLVLIDPAPSVTQVLKITGLLEVFGLPLPAVPTAWQRDTKSGDTVRSHRPVPMQELLAQSAAVRQEARQTRERAKAMRRDDSLRRMRLGMPQAQPSS